MIFVGFVYLRGTQNKYFIAYFTLILHKTKPSACLEKIKIHADGLYI